VNTTSQVITDSRSLPCLYS